MVTSPEMTTTDSAPESVEELLALWDRLRDEAVSSSDRQEIDAIFSRYVP